MKCQTLVVLSVLALLCKLALNIQHITEISEYLFKFTVDTLEGFPQRGNITLYI